MKTTCDKCLGTGHSNLGLSQYLDCIHCEAATERAQLNAQFPLCAKLYPDSLWGAYNAGRDPLRASIAELEREVAANREKLAAPPAASGQQEGIETAFAHAMKTGTGFFRIEAIDPADVLLPAPAQQESEPACATCNDNGAVGGPTNAEPCPECSYGNALSEPECGWFRRGYEVAKAEFSRAPAPAALTDEQIAAAVRPLYDSDEAAKMGCPDDIITVRAVLRAIGAAPAEQARDADDEATLEAQWEARKEELRAEYPDIAGNFKVFGVLVETEIGSDPADGDFSIGIHQIINGVIDEDDLEFISEAVAENASALNLKPEGQTEILAYESGEREDVFWHKYYRVVAIASQQKGGDGHG